MQGTKKCVDSRQLHNEDYLQEVRVEPRSTAGVPSISSMPEEGRDDGNEYAGKLLEEILHRDNLNLAYVRERAIGTQPTALFLQEHLLMSA